MSSPGLSTEKLLDALGDKAFRDKFFVRSQAIEALASWRKAIQEKGCHLCNLNPVLREILRQTDLVAEHFGEQYRPWLEQFKNLP